MNGSFLKQRNYESYFSFAHFQMFPNVAKYFCDLPSKKIIKKSDTDFN